jgi:hypothetical protein
MLGGKSGGAWALALVAIVACLVWPAGSSAGPRFDRSDPVFRAGDDQANAQRENLAVKRRDPLARAERLRSRSAHSGLDRADAVALARGRFGHEMTGDLVDGSRLPMGVKISRILDETNARVESAAGEPLGVMHATVPLATSRGDTWTATDLSLRAAAGGRYMPGESASSLSLPGRAGQSARFSRSRLGFGIPTSSSAEAIVRDDRLFFPDAAGVDTDYVLKPTATGAEAFWVLRSSSSPSEVRQHFDLPAGARLEMAPAEPYGPPVVGARILAAGGSLLATVTPPLANDADGTPVPGRRGMGDQLRLQVRDRIQHRLWL